MSEHDNSIGIPTLVIVDENGKVITANGRGAVTMDPTGEVCDRLSTYYVVPYSGKLL